MAKNDKAGNADINAEIKKSKKKMLLIFVVVTIIALVIGGFFGIKFFSASSADKAAVQKELESLDLKDYPVGEADSKKIYSRDIAKQTYILKNGAILFEGTLVFHNKLTANLYNGITDRKEQLSTEPDMSAESIFGDKLAKDALNRYLQETNKLDLSSTQKVSEGLKNAINKQFKDTFGHEVVKNILVTSHIIQ